MDWRQIFWLPEEMRQRIVTTLQYLKLYADKVKDIGGSIESLWCASYNTAAVFTEDDLLFRSMPYNRPLFVTGHITE